MATEMIEQLFHMPLPEKNPNLDVSIPPWNVDDSMKTGDDLHSFTEIFAQVHYIHQDPPESFSSSLYTLSPSSSLSSEFSHPPSAADVDEGKLHLFRTRSDSVSSCNSEHSSVCNDVIESPDDVDESDKCGDEEEEEIHHCHARREHKKSRHLNRSRKKYGGFPPPISCIGISGKPWVLLQSVRQDGRFSLREVRIPTQEFLHACRENGRLKMQFVLSDEEEEEEEGRIKWWERRSLMEREKGKR